MRLCRCSPDTTLLADARGIDVEVRSSACPVGNIGNSNGDFRGHNGWNQHGLVARKNSLTPGQVAMAFVHSLDSASSLNTVGLLRKGLFHDAAVITV